MSKKRGVTLVSLTIVVTVILILTGVIIYNIRDSLGISKLREMQNDIQNLRELVNNYYATNGKIPAKLKYTNAGNIEKIKDAGVISEKVDIGDFYIIDLSELENLTLNYGEDYKNITDATTEEEASQYEDIYIINETSQNIFYVEGIELDGDWFYTDYTSEDVDSVGVDLRYVEGVKIPEGFYYVGGTKEEGIVISDNIEDLGKGDSSEAAENLQGNQFVWIPVGNFDEFEREHFGTEAQKWWTGTFVTDGLSDNNFYEPASDGIMEDTEVEKMYKSVKENKGFYVGRYEAGTTASSGTGIRGEVVSKKEANVYNNVKWGNSMTDETGGAVEVARGMYNEEKGDSVTSTLIYGVQWDAIMRWMQDVPNLTGGKYVEDSTGMGLYSDNASGNETHQTGIDLDGGKNKVKNIYDLAGNVLEWTMESYNTTNRIYRGGDYVYSGSDDPASVRRISDIPSSSYTGLGFRIALYLNLEEKWSPTYDENGVYTDKNGDTAYIPKGFQVSEKKGETLIDEGLVIKDEEGNQFVWIPVDNIEDMAKLTSGIDENGNQNYEGKPYDFIYTRASEKINYGQGTEEYREPDIVSSYDNNAAYLDIIKGILTSEEDRNKYANINTLKSTMQQDFNKMIKSVKEYGGFYIGRYEMSKSDNNIVQSKANSIALTADNDNSNDKINGNTWYGLYAYGKTYTNSANSVESSIVWGSQYDAMMRWMQNTGVDVTATNDDIRSIDEIYTGSKTDKDIIKNIYDLYGGKYEWTLEANLTSERSYRGGYYDLSASISNRNNDFPPDSYEGAGTRLTIYTK